MDIWSILEIEPTTETSIIKKAYAKKLKIFHPEDDPAGYQKLREAFDSALKYAKNNKVQEIKGNDISEQIETFKQNNVLEQHEPLKENNLSEQNKHTEENKLIEQSESKQEENDDDLSNKKFRKLKILEEYHYYESNIEINDADYTRDFAKSEQLIDQLFENLTDLYKDFFERIEIKNWQESLNTEIMWDLDYRDDISRRMINFLDDHRHIPQNIFQFLNEDFHWTEDEEKLKSYINRDFLSYFYKQINGEKGNRYCYFRKDIQIDYDKYLDYRDSAASLLSQNKLYSAEDCLQLAYDMYQYDPDLLCMIGEYYLKKKTKWTKLVWAFHTARKLNKKDIDTKLYQVEIFLKTQKVRQATILCKLILRNKPDDFDIRTILGVCYLSGRKLLRAKRIFLKNLKENPSDIFTINKLYVVAEYLNKLYYKYPWSIIIRENLKETYLVLGEQLQIQKIKFKPSDISKLFKFLFNGLFKIMVPIVTIILLIISRFTSGLPYLIIIYYIVRKFWKKR